MLPLSWPRHSGVSCILWVSGTESGLGGRWGVVFWRCGFGGGKGVVAERRGTESRTFK